MRLVAAVLCGALLIVPSSCRKAPTEEELVEAHAVQLQAALLARLDPRQQRLFPALERTGYRPRLVGTVGADVFAFREALGPGAALRGDPFDHLANLKSTGSAQWLRAPVDTRVFATGFGTDGPPISMYVEMLRADGYQVFLYNFCEGQQTELTGCPKELVGAYFATAGHLLIGTSEARVRSGLVLAEANAAPASPDARRAVLVTPTRPITIGEAAATDFLAVEMATRPLGRSGGGQR